MRKNHPEHFEPNGAAILHSNDQCYVRKRSNHSIWKNRHHPIPAFNTSNFPKTESRMENPSARYAPDL